MPGMPFRIQHPTLYKRIVVSHNSVLCLGPSAGVGPSIDRKRVSSFAPSIVSPKSKTKSKKSSASEEPEDFQEDIDLKAFQDHRVNKRLTAEEKLDLYTLMVRIRRFEERAVRGYQQGKIGGFLHDYIGQESVAAGSIPLMEGEDQMITAYRDHGQALAVGMSMKECMAELYGRHTGCSKGKGGSMHFFAPDKHYWGGHGIVGGQTPLGAGLAYALKYRGIKACALCFLGDGAVNQGAFHESLNLAQLFELPVVYIIENNGYSMGTSQDRSSTYVDCLAKRAEGYNMAWDYGNGHLLYEVRARVLEAMERARKKSLPTLLELKTYRYRGHSIADANFEKYRTKEEIKRIRETLDPIMVFQNLLIEEGLLDEDKVKEIDKAARQEALEAAEFADQSPYPPEEEIVTDVYWTTDNPGKHDNQGRIFFND